MVQFLTNEQIQRWVVIASQLPEIPYLI